MKRNKKLMLTAIAAMGVVAMGVGGAGTFAWYQASRAGGVAQTAESSLQIITADDPGYTASAVELGGLKVKVERVEIKESRGTSRSLELAHYYAQNAAKDLISASTGLAIGNHAAGLFHAYYKTSNVNSIVYKPATAAASLGSESVDPYAAYKVSAYVQFPTTTGLPTAHNDPDLNGVYTPHFWNDGGTVKWCDANGNDWIQTEVVNELSSTTVSIEVDRDNTNGTSRAMFFSLSNADVDGVDLAVANGNNNPDAITKSLSGLAAGESNALVVASFGLYIEGEDGGTMDTTDPIGDFKVTVSKVA